MMLNISSKHLEIINGILKKNIPDSVLVWVFGSRVFSEFKPYSDLDLALQSTTENKISIKVIAAIQADFIESDLPWKVDIIDYNSISGVFKENVDQQKIAFQIN